MSKKMADFYLTLLSAPAPSVEIQKRAFSYADRKKVDVIKMRLAGLENLDPEVDEKIGQSSSARVIAAWVARPSRTSEKLNELAFKTKSITVRKCLAMHQGLEPETYQHLAAKANGGIALELARNEATSREIKIEAVKVLASAQLNYTTRREVAAILETDPDLVEAFIFAEPLTRDTFDLLSNVSYMPPNVQDHVFKSIVEASKYEEGIAGGMFDGKNPPKFNPSTAVMAIARRSDLITKHAEEVLSMPRVLRGMSTYALNEFKNSIKRGAARSGPTYADVLAMTDSQDLMDVVESVVNNRSSLFASAVANNPNSTASMLAEVLKYSGWSTNRTLVKQFQRDPEKLMRVLYASPVLISDDVLARSGAPTGVLTELIKELVENSKRIPAGVSASKYLTPKMVTLMPSYFFLKTDIPTEAKETAQRLLESTFGSHLEAWDTFETLVESHEGTIGELIEIVATLSEINEITDSEESDLQEEVSEEAAPQAAEVSEPKAKASPKKEVRLDPLKTLGTPLF